MHNHRYNEDAEHQKMQLKIPLIQLKYHPIKYQNFRFGVLRLAHFFRKEGHVTSNQFCTYIWSQHDKAILGLQSIELNASRTLRTNFLFSLSELPSTLIKQWKLCPHFKSQYGARSSFHLRIPIRIQQSGTNSGRCDALPRRMSPLFEVIFEKVE